MNCLCRVCKTQVLSTLATIAAMVVLVIGCWLWTAAKTMPRIASVFLLIMLGKFPASLERPLPDVPEY